MKTMTVKRAWNLRTVTAAACIASILMFAHALVHRALAEALAISESVSPIDTSILKAFPLYVGDWAGQEEPIDEAILNRTDAQGHISRRYVRKSGLEAVSFYLAYGTRARDLMPHRPEVCYVGNGWTLAGRRSMTLPVTDGTMLPCNLIEFSRGLLNTERLLVLHYYVVDGQRCQDVSLLRSKAWRGSGAVRYVVQVQIVTSIGEVVDTGSAMQGLCDFAEASALPISGLFERSCR